MKITLLGCGTSGGVPRLAGEWGACDPDNPKNMRRRVSILVEQGDTRVLVDTSPDLRMQLIDASVTRLDAVLYTHDHADHTHGIDDLRSIFYAMKRRPVNVYGDKTTLDALTHKFDYAFVGRGGYPAICTANVINVERKQKISIGAEGLEITPFYQKHGPVMSVGYLFEMNGKRAGYSTDLNGLPDESKALLNGIDLWIVDALRYQPHPTHAHLDMSLTWIKDLHVKQAVLTHMTWDMDYETVNAETPEHVLPGYDGLEIIV